jgi:transforming growth factor-beta-induced protein
MNRLIRLLSSTLAFLLIATVLLAAAGCADDPIEEEFNLLGFIDSRPEVTVLAQLLRDAGLADLAAEEAPITFFAPVNSAFAEFDLEGLDMDELAEILRHHIVPAPISAIEFSHGLVLQTLTVHELTLSLVENVPYVNEARILAIDGFATNGILHLIDSVMLPEEPVENDEE